MSKTLDVQKDENIVTIRLNRPESFNSINDEMGDELIEAVSSAAGDRSIRAIIITGNGKAFCAGGDIQFMMNWDGPKREALGALTQRLHRLILDLRKMPKPVIAAINGTASGGGFSLAMACDFRIAAADATFKQSYTSIGLGPDGGWTVSVARQIGLLKATELLLLDPVLKADRVFKLGLINRIVPADELMKEAEDLARQVASRSQIGFASGKELLNQSMEFDLAEQLEAERNEIMKACEAIDFDEGISAFMEKRAPVFKGTV